MRVYCKKLEKAHKKFNFALT